MDRLICMANIVGVCVVAFAATAFLALAIFYFKANKKVLYSGLDDDVLRKEADRWVAKNRKHYDTVHDGLLRFEHEQRRAKRDRNVVWYVCVLFCVVLFGSILCFNVMTNERHVWLGDTTFLTIETSSMSTANKTNGYLFDENGKADEDDRLLQYTLITISRKPARLAAIQVGDVVAFTMKSEKGEEITVVHRLIQINQDATGAPLYTFRGDANPASMAGELGVSQDRIVGVYNSGNYHGFESVFLGHFITFLRSTAGRMTSAIAFLVLVLFLSLSDKNDKVFEERYKLVVKTAIIEDIRYSKGGKKCD